MKSAKASYSYVYHPRYFQLLDIPLSMCIQIIHFDWIEKENKSAKEENIFHWFQEKIFTASNNWTFPNISSCGSFMSLRNSYWYAYCIFFFF